MEFVILFFSSPIGPLPETTQKSLTMMAENDDEEQPLNDRKRPQENLITPEGEHPQKRYYRRKCELANFFPVAFNALILLVAFTTLERAHCNPLAHNDAFHYPSHPNDMRWTDEHYPGLPVEKSQPTVLDIGCGFGGLTLALATLLPKEVILGMEIRIKVTEYVRLRILAARKEHSQTNNTDDSTSSPSPYQNCSVMRTNSMKFLPNYFHKASLHKLFFCFPDPHFKKKNHPRRIISERLLSEYAYFLKPGLGKLYCITDVKELHEWHVEKCNGHPMFARVPDTEAEEDPCVQAMKVETEEGKKVARNGGDKYYAVYRRIADDDALKLNARNFFP